MNYHSSARRANTSVAAATEHLDWAELAADLLIVVVEPAAVPCSLGCSLPKSSPGCLRGGPWRLRQQLPGKSLLGSIMAATTVAGFIKDSVRLIAGSATVTSAS